MATKNSINVWDDQSTKTERRLRKQTHTLTKKHSMFKPLSSRHLVTVSMQQQTQQQLEVVICHRQCLHNHREQRNTTQNSAISNFGQTLFIRPLSKWPALLNLPKPACTIIYIYIYMIYSPTFTIKIQPKKTHGAVGNYSHIFPWESAIGARWKPMNPTSPSLSLYCARRSIEAPGIILSRFNRYESIKRTFEYLQEIFQVYSPYFFWLKIEKNPCKMVETLGELLRVYINAIICRLPETNIWAPETSPSQKETIVFQASIFRGDLLVSGRVQYFL